MFWVEVKEFLDYFDVLNGFIIINFKYQNYLFVLLFAIKFHQEYD